MCAHDIRSQSAYFRVCAMLNDRSHAICEATIVICAFLAVSYVALFFQDVVCNIMKVDDCNIREREYLVEVNVIYKKKSEWSCSVPCATKDEPIKRYWPPRNVN